MTQQDSDSITISVDAAEKTFTIRGTELEFNDIVVIMASIVIIAVAAFYFGTV